MRTPLLVAAAVGLCAAQHLAGAQPWTPDSWVTAADASFWGETDNDNAGYGLAMAGDVDGDGYDDLLIGAPGNDDAASGAGQVYLIFGGSGGWAMDTDLSSAGASFLGEGTADNAGMVVCAAGDVDGDGRDDFTVGAPLNDEGGSNAGQVYLVFGAAGGWAMNRDLGTAADASFLGEAAADNAGLSLAGGGDLDGDGYDDLVIGAPFGDDGGTDAGEVYVVYGGSGGWAMDVDLSAADASFVGEAAQDHAGTAAAVVGDVDGDGLDDLLIGAPDDDEAGSDAGQVYLLFGTAARWSIEEDLAWSDASFLGETGQDVAGDAVAGAGDVDGDGYDDLLIGARDSDAGGASAGQAYLILGRPSGWAMDMDLGSADASFWGEGSQDYAGAAVAGAGDVNDDGYDDLLVAAFQNDEGLTGGGQTYLILGRSSGWAMDTDLGDADASFWGETVNDATGWSVAGGGDADDDGYDDFLLGSIYNAAGGTSAGQVYLFLGGPACADTDGDGYGDPGAATCSGGSADDCDDADAAIHPGAVETCDGVDNDCDGLVDDDDPGVTGTATWYRDADGDGYGDPTTSTQACDQPSGYVSDATDCDDGDPGQNPGGQEVCNGEDDDCDGLIDGDDPDNAGDDTWYVDDDGDGYGDPGTTQLACSQPAGYTNNDDDCDDGDAAIHPGAAETCDNVDNDCDGLVDDDDPGVTGTSIWYDDDDGDGYGDPSESVWACDAPAGSVANNADCDDTDASVNPDGTEVCDGVDNDCDGLWDGDDPDATGQTTWYRDADGDGYGTPGTTTAACSAPAGYVGNADDCDDGDASVNPDAAEVCNGMDDDCDGLVDDADGDVTGGATWYADDDGDGYGDSAATVESCDQPGGYVSNADDCDDSEAAIHPGATEICDGLNNDCDFTTSENDDDDGDGYTECDGDCDDGDAWTHPGATEICDGADNDCDPSTDEDADNDGDGYSSCDGDCEDTVDTVHPGATEVCDGYDTDCDGSYDTNEVDNDGDGYWLCADDCDDQDASVHPGATELCDGLDNDCDGVVDEGTEDDADGDGYNTCQGDCDDTDPESYPGAIELCDGLDNDCDGEVGADEVDADGDGWWVCDGDCDDADPALNLDDLDGDGVDTCGDDCDDQDPDRSPDLDERCGDGIDNDCDGRVDDVDADRDGRISEECGGDDCDDANALINIYADELCSDGWDNDCDGLVDQMDEECESGGDGCICRHAPAASGPSPPSTLAALLLAGWLLGRRRGVPCRGASRRPAG